MLVLLKRVSPYGLAFLFLFALVACTQEVDSLSSLDPKDNVFNIVNAKTNLSLLIPFSESGVALSFEDEQAIHSYLSKIFVEKKFDALDQVEVLVDFDYNDGVISNPVVTLLAMGHKDGSQFPVAQEFYKQRNLKTGGGGFGPLDGGDVHSCTGNPCSCCNLIKEQYRNGPFLSSRVIGCKCNQNPASEICTGEESTCNHIVSTAP